MAESIEESIPSERVATLMAQPHGDLSDAAEQLAALVTAASAELLDVICAIDRKQSWKDDGATSPEAWVVGMLRISYATAREWVRVARALEGAILNAALEQRAERVGANPENGLWDPAPMRQADALVDLARADVLDNPGPDPTVVVVHIDADVVDGTVEGNGSIDDIPIPVDSVRRLLCDCKVELSIDGPDGTCIGIGRADRAQPRWMRRRLTHRDGTCRFPGCGRPIRHFHHIHHWTKGGPTDSYNLVGLCWDHHHLVHEGGWTIDGNADAALNFTSPFGRMLCSRPRPLDPRVRRRAQEASGTDLGADRDDLPPTGTDPPR